MRVRCTCTQCGRAFTKERSQLNRALKASPGKLYCSQRCFGLARRDPNAWHRRPVKERKARKAAYDAARRAGPMRNEILAEKRAYYRETRDPIRMARERFARRDWQRSYARRYNARPENKARKRAYDMRRRGKAFAEWSGAHRALLKLEREIRRLVPDKYERLKARGYYGQGRSTSERKKHEGISRW